MPYFVYRVEPGPTQLLKQLTLLETFDAFKSAKTFAREQRATQTEDETAVFKVIFAGNALEAEAMLQEKREAPVLKEWEK